MIMMKIWSRVVSGNDDDELSLNLLLILTCITCNTSSFHDDYDDDNDDNDNDEDDYDEHDDVSPSLLLLLPCLV